MKKIGIITFHFAKNIGAVLQCVGLYKQLQKMGFEPYVINYRPKYHEAKYAAWKPPFYLAKQYSIMVKHMGIKDKHLLFEILKRFASVLWGNRLFFANKKKNHCFEQFLLQYLKQSTLYRNINQLKNNPPKGDIYICGSDQIWNKSLTNGIYDQAYFLQFGDSVIKRIAYAVSMGETDILADTQDYINNTKMMDNISFRETCDCAKANKITQKHHQTVRDPSLFLNKDEWELFEKEVDVKTPYIFVYTVLKSEVVKRIVTEACDNHKVIDVSNHKYIHGNKNYTYNETCGPGEFLSYIKNAQFVITNSFHGTVFSIIYHKSFITIANKKRNERMEELLKFVGLEGRFLNDINFVEIEKLEEIDYQLVDEKLKLGRMHDINFLYQSFEL